MDIDKEYAFELLKKLKHTLPFNTYQINFLPIKEQIHILYLADLGLLKEYQSKGDKRTNFLPYFLYRITAQGLDLLSGDNFMEWVREKECKNN